MVVATTAFTSSLTAASEKNADIPKEYSELIPTDAYAVGWVGDVKGIISVFNEVMPPEGHIPSKPKELLSSIISFDPNVQVGNSVIGWSVAGPSEGGGRPGDPMIFLAVSAPGANAKNTHAGSDTTLHFSNDMVIASQGMNTKWEQPTGAPNRLIKDINSDPISIAVDVKEIWKDQGQQIQMLGGFGAMAAQMSLMQQAQNGDPDEQARARAAQKKIGEVMRDSLSGVFELLKSMDTMTLSMGLKKDGMMSVTSHFNFMEDVNAGSGVTTKVIDATPGGMPIYYSMNAKMQQWLINLDLNLEDALMIGLDKKQQAELDAILPMITDLSDTITGGMMMGIDIHPRGLQEVGVFQVQDSREFINGLGLVMAQLDKVDMGWNSTKNSNGNWAIKMDGKKLAKSFANPEMQMVDELPLFNNGINIQLTGKDDLVHIVVDMGPPAVKETGHDYFVRDMLKPADSENLIVGFAIDIRELVLKAMTVAPVSPQDAAKVNQLFAREKAPVPIKLLGTSEGKTFTIGFGTNLKKILKVGLELDEISKSQRN